MKKLQLNSLKVKSFITSKCNTSAGSNINSKKFCISAELKDSEEMCGNPTLQGHTTVYDC